MANRIVNTIEFEHAQILRGSFKNFSGAKTQYNTEGRRNFHVVIDSLDDVNRLKELGMPVKILAPKDPADPEIVHLKINLKYHPEAPERNPKIYRVLVDQSGNVKSKVLLDEDSVKCLDHDDIEYADLKISPFHWEYAGKEGVTAYLVSMYCIVNEDPFDSKYSVEDDSADIAPF